MTNYSSFQYSTLAIIFFCEAMASPQPTNDFTHQSPQTTQTSVFYYPYALNLPYLFCAPCYMLTPEQQKEMENRATRRAEALDRIVEQLGTISKSMDTIIESLEEMNKEVNKL